MGQPTRPTQPSIPPGSVTEYRNACNYKYYVGGDHQTAAVWLPVKVRGRMTGPRHWHTQVQIPHWIFRIFLNCVFANILSKPCSYTRYILNFLQENVNNCTLISHIASASGGRSPQTSYRGFAPGPHWEMEVPQTSSPGPLHCKILGTPMDCGLLYTRSICDTKALLQLRHAACGAM